MDIAHISRITRAEPPEILISNFAARELEEIIKPGLHCYTILGFLSIRRRLI
jgi:hypothetical protein